VAKIRTKKALEEYDDEYLACRTFMHAWKMENPEHVGPPPFGSRMSLRCTRCGAWRHDLVTFRGDLLARRYELPEGYRVMNKGGTKAVVLPRKECRAEMVRRTQ
jgi:hypothetical protein